MRLVLDPDHLTRDERRRGVAALLAEDLRRLRDRAGLASLSAPENPEKSELMTLETVPRKSLTDHAG